MRARELVLAGFSSWGLAHIIYNVAGFDTFIIHLQGWAVSPLTILGFTLIVGGVVVWLRRGLTGVR